MKLEEKQELLQLLVVSRDTFAISIADFTEESARLSPGPGKWSALECAEHVAIAEQYLLAQVLSSKPSEVPPIDPRREKIIRLRATDRTKRVEAPDAAKPTGRFGSIDEALRHFESCRKRTIEFVENSDAHLRLMMTEHPVMGVANAYEVLLMIAMHPLRHSKQIEEIRNVSR